MDKLDQVYEAFEMLKELELPVSVEMLEKIERLEDEKGIEHREDFRNYFLQQHFVFFTKRILNIRQAKVHGEIIVAKPVLLLAVIDGIENGEFRSNEFRLTDLLEERYLALMRQYRHSSQFDKPTDISNPYWHLQNDGFWFLQYIHELTGGVTPSKKWLKDNVEYAYIDENLWFLLQNKTWRLRLRDFIVEKKL